MWKNTPAIWLTQHVSNLLKWPFFITQTRFRLKKPDWLVLNHDSPILPRLPHPPPNHFKLYAHVLTHQSIPPSSLPKSLELIRSLAKMTLKIKILRGVKLDSMFHFYLFILCFMICFWIICLDRECKSSLLIFMFYFILHQSQLSMCVFFFFFNKF